MAAAILTQDKQICSHEECKNYSYARGFCKSHYTVFKRNGKLKGNVYIINMPIKDRLMKQIEVAQSGCWNWIGSRNKAGYGRISVNNKLQLAHRVSYKEFIGDLPDELFVCHKCDNPSCINPDHLYAGNVQNNADDAVERMLMCHSEDRSKVLTNIEAAEILIDIRPQRQIAKDYGVCQQTVSNIKTGKRWKYLER